MRLARRAPWNGAAALVAGLVLTACGSTVQLTGSQVPGQSPADTVGLGPDAGAPGSPSASTSQGGLGEAGGESRPTQTGVRRPGLAGSDGRSGKAPPVTATTPLPRSGFGWDAAHVYVGVTVYTDVNNLARAAGSSGIDFGDQEAETRAAVAQINAAGGVLGRKVVPVFYDQRTSDSESTSVQAACTRFTEDRPVAIVLDLLPVFNTDQFYSCMAAHRISVLSHSQVVFTDTDLARHQPFLSYLDDVSYDRLVAPWLSRLSALGYFSGWDTAAGRASKARVVVGILHHDTPSTARGMTVLSNALRSRGVQVAKTQSYSVSNGLLAGQQDVQNAVLQFQASGVTHAFVDFPANLTFLTAAEQQRYRPRYAVNTQHTLTLLQQLAPARQLVGTVGIGWSPTSDVAEAQDPGLGAQQECERTMKRYDAYDDGRQAQWFSAILCDGFGLFVQAATAGRGFDVAAVHRGLALRAPHYDYGLTFGATPDPNRPDRMGVVRDIGYSTGCICFRYLSRSNHAV